MKKLEKVYVDWNSPRSVDKGERKKAKLENLGYTLIRTNSGLDYVELVYVLKD